MGIKAFFEKVFGKKSYGTGERTGIFGKGNGKDDAQILCVECKRPFVFEAGEQKFYKMRGLTPPKRCSSCRTKRKRHHRN